LAVEESAKKRQARRHFDRWSRRYEDDRVSRWIAELQSRAYEELQLRADDRFLDVGCGTGAAVRTAAPEVTRSVGVDLSEGMIARAKELAADLDNTEFVEGDSEALPFGEAEFSAILCTNSFHHYPDPVAAVREMARVLAPGGRVVIGDGCTDNRVAWLVNLILRTFQPSHIGFYTSERLHGLLREGGLTLTGSHLLYSGGYQICSAHKVLSG
jgi:ubiquinone/menaquinone biosynthesis C-methylase UbiE